MLHAILPNEQGLGQSIHQLPQRVHMAKLNKKELIYPPSGYFDNETKIRDERSTSTPSDPVARSEERN